MRDYKKIDINEFLNQLRGKYKIKRDTKRITYMGESILTKNDMRIMCSHFFGYTYDNLSNGDKNLLIDKIFNEMENIYGRVD